MEISSNLPFQSLPLAGSTSAASTDGDDSGDEVGARKGGRRSAFRSLGVAAHDAWVSQNEGAVEGSEAPESTVTAAEGEQAANSDGDQSAGGQRGSDTRSAALLSQARKKWSERIRAPGETALAGERLGLLLDAVAESLPLRPGSRHALQIQIVSRLAHLAEQIVAARAAGQQVFVRRSLTQAEWSMAQQAGGRPGLTEVSLALQGQRPQSPNGADKPPGRSLDHALLPLLMLQSLAPQYGKKRGITSAVHQVMMKRF